MNVGACGTLYSLKVYKEVITSLSKNYCRDSHFNKNQSEILKEMIDSYWRHFNKNEMSYKIY